MAFSSHNINCGMVFRLANICITIITALLLSTSISDVRGARMVTRQMNMTFEMGRDATLTCSVRNIGKRRVIWKRLSDPFPIAVGTTRFWPTSKYRVKRNGEDWQLIIRKVKHSDAGEYECRLSGREDIADVLSLIIPGAGHTHLLPTDTTVTALEGDTAVLPCHVNNLRKSLVLWQSQGGQLISLRKKTYSGDKRQRVLHSQRQQWSLQVRNVRQEDFGVYTCVVNTNPPLTRTVHLVQGKPKKPTQGRDKIPETRPSKDNSPTLVRNTFREEVDVMQYQSVTLFCQFTGHPKPNIHWERRLWTRDGVKIVQDLKTQGETYTLNNAQPEDTGIYVCKASNGVPPPEQAKIRVKVKEVITTTTPKPTTTTFDPVNDVAPKVYALEEIVFQELGRDAELACRGVGVPRPQVHWIVDGTPVQDNYKYGVHNENYRHHTIISRLHIRSLSPGNYKKYQCYVFNKYGDDSTAIVLAEPSS